MPFNIEEKGAKLVSARVYIIVFIFVENIRYGLKQNQGKGVPAAWKLRLLKWTCDASRNK